MDYFTDSSIGNYNMIQSQITDAQTAAQLEVEEPDPAKFVENLKLSIIVSENGAGRTKTALAKKRGSLNPAGNRPLAAKMAGLSPISLKSKAAPSAYDRAPTCGTSICTASNYGHHDLIIQVSQKES